MHGGEAGAASCSICNESLSPPLVFRPYGDGPTRKPLGGRVITAGTEEESNHYLLTVYKCSKFILSYFFFLSFFPPFLWGRGRGEQCPWFLNYLKLIGSWRHTHPPCRAVGNTGSQCAPSTAWEVLAPPSVHFMDTDERLHPSILPNTVTASLYPPHSVMVLRFC